MSCIFSRPADTGNCCGGWCLGLRLNLRVASTAGQEDISHTAPGVHFRQRSDHWPVVLSVYQRGSLLDNVFVVWYEEVPRQWKHTHTCNLLHNFWTSAHRIFGCFNNIKSVIGQQVNEMMVLKLVKTYCLPRLLYGCERWPSETVNMHELDVIWNNGFRHIFNCCWRESVKPLQFFCQSLPLSYLIEERQLMFFLVSYNVLIILYCEL